MQDRTKGYRTVNAKIGIYNISERMLIIEPSTYCSIDFQSGIHFWANFSSIYISGRLTPYLIAMV